MFRYLGNFAPEILSPARQDAMWIKPDNRVSSGQHREVTAVLSHFKAAFEQVIQTLQHAGSIGRSGDTCA